MSNYAVAYRQEKGQPWIGLPGVATDGDAAQMFDAAGLGGWDVRKEEIITGARTDSPDFEVIRTNPQDSLLDRLAIAKGRYHTYQNEKVLEFGLTLAHGDVEPVAMGALDGGRKIFMSFKMGDSITIGGTDDKVDHFLNLMSSHDGSWSFGTYSGNMRLRCQNMLRSIRSNALSSFKIRHTQTMEGRIEDARKALGRSFQQNEAFAADMASLASVDVSDAKFWEIVEKIYPRPEKDVRGSLKKWETKTDQIMGIWNGVTLDGVDKTAYRAYNALNEHLLWYSSVRAGNVENALVRASGMDDNAINKDVSLYRQVLALS